MKADSVLIRVPSCLLTEQNSTITFEIPREWQVIVETFITFQKG
jgi:hypothetical protein